MVVLKLIVAAILTQASLVDDMRNLRDILNENTLKQKQVQEELLQQEVFLTQLKEEQKRLAPLIQESRNRFLHWMDRLISVPPPQDLRVLPYPSFDPGAQDRQAFAEVVREELTRSYVELSELQKHFKDTEHQITRITSRVQEQKNQLVEIQDNLKQKLSQKELLRSRLLKNPRLMARIQQEYLQMKRETEHVTAPSHEPEQPATLGQGGNYRLYLPVQGTLIRDFGKQIHPRYLTVTENKGVHLEVQSGQEVEAVLPGEVVFVGYYGLFGQLVMVRHENGVRTLYSGFSKVFVEVGQRVEYRQPIGLSGHGFGLEYEGVYFEVRLGKTAVNPRTWFAKSSRG